MDILTRLELPSITNLPKDDVTMTMAWAGVDDLAAVDMLTQTIPFWFLNTVPTNGLAALGQFISPEITRAVNKCRCKAYDITGKLGYITVNGKQKLPNVGSPVAETDFTLVAPALPANPTPLPAEVAFVVTLEATGRADQPVEAPDGDVPPDGKANRPRSRYTGRIYVGPLHVGSIQAGAGPCRPSSALRDTALLAVDELASRAVADAGAVLSVWSRKDAVLREVDDVSADDSFDTQRRRGNSPTLRTRIGV